jgi:uncharacterized protein (DUF302 family)
MFGSPRVGNPLMVASPLLAIELLQAVMWQAHVGQLWVSSDNSDYLAPAILIVC